MRASSRALRSRIVFCFSAPRRRSLVHSSASPIFSSSTAPYLSCRARIWALRSRSSAVSIASPPGPAPPRGSPAASFRSTTSSSLAKSALWTESSWPRRDSSCSSIFCSASRALFSETMCSSSWRSKFSSIPASFSPMLDPSARLASISRRPWISRSLAMSSHSSLAFFFRSSAFDTSLLMRAMFLIFLALLPNRIVETVSGSLLRAGEQLMISAVRQLPPNAS
mmetsp:Transcript_47620/g.113373  ORF Transcript_47620/g.113373 Transcript_47620/m.113373 type:complete len:224 (-) Transcript_47620:1023-1694(-)